MCNHKEIFDFLQPFLFIVLGKTKDFKNNQIQQVCSLSIKDISLFPHLLDVYSKLPNKLNATVNFDYNLQDNNYSKILLSSFQLFF